MLFLFGVGFPFFRLCQHVVGILCMLFLFGVGSPFFRLCQHVVGIFVQLLTSRAITVLILKKYNQILHKYDKENCNL